MWKKVKKSYLFPGIWTVIIYLSYWLLNASWWQKTVEDYLNISCRKHINRCCTCQSRVSRVQSCPFLAFFSLFASAVRYDKQYFEQQPNENTQISFHCCASTQFLSLVITIGEMSTSVNKRFRYSSQTMDPSVIPVDVFSSKGDAFYTFVRQSTSEDIEDLLRIQRISTARSFLNTNPLAFFIWTLMKCRLLIYKVVFLAKWQMDRRLFWLALVQILFISNNYSNYFRWMMRRRRRLSQRLRPTLVIVLHQWPPGKQHLPVFL